MGDKLIDCIVKTFARNRDRPIWQSRSCRRMDWRQVRALDRNQCRLAERRDTV